MWIALAFIGLGLTGFPSIDMTVGSSGPDAAKPAVLELMGLDAGDLALKLEYPWGSIGANHALLDDHAGPFVAVVEPSADGSG